MWLLVFSSLVLFNEIYGVCKSECTYSCSLQIIGKTCNGKCIGSNMCGGKCTSDNDAEPCSMECIGAACKSSCEGSGCKALCVGDGCSTTCTGAHCYTMANLTTTDRNGKATQKLYAKCTGSNCTAECGGVNCQVTCDSQSGLKCNSRCLYQDKEGTCSSYSYKARSSDEVKIYV